MFEAFVYGASNPGPEMVFARQASPIYFAQSTVYITEVALADLILVRLFSCPLVCSCLNKTRRRFIGYMLFGTEIFSFLSQLSLQQLV